MSELARAFFGVIAGDAHGELVELRYRHGDGMQQVFASRSGLASLARMAIRLGRDTDVYVGCAPRTRRYGGRAAITGGFLLWADCDGPEAVAALDAFRPMPAVRVVSGSGSNCHAYWRLDRRVGIEQLELGNRRLAAALGADLASAEPARILRVPGTTNQKHKPPAPVRAVRFEPGRLIDYDRFVGQLPDAPASARLVSSDGRGGDEDPLLAIAPDVYVARLLGVTVPPHRKVTCPFHAPDRHPSLHVYREPERGWFCFGACRRGGTIYDLAGPLLGYQLRGEGFLRLREELAVLFGIQAGGGGGDRSCSLTP